MRPETIFANIFWEFGLGGMERSLSTAVGQVFSDGCEGLGSILFGSLNWQLRVVESAMTLKIDLNVVYLPWGTKGLPT